MFLPENFGGLFPRHTRLWLPTPTKLSELPRKKIAQCLLSQLFSKKKFPSPHFHSTAAPLPPT
jgi:hypothetical protein